MEFPDKSNPQSEKPKREAVVQAKKVDRPATKRFKDFLFAESPKQLLSKIGRDVLEPRLKSGIEEALNSFISGMMWGDSSNRPSSSTVGRTVLRGGSVSYNQISTGHQSLLAQARSANTSTSTGNYQDLVVPSQNDAEVLLANLYELLNEYRVVAVADLYEIAGITPSPSDGRYGWTSLDGARISKVREGYLLELPRPTLI